MELLQSEIYSDDPMVSKNLEKIIATDINDTRYAKTRYIEIYHKQKNKLPFPVEEIPMTVTKASQVQNLYKKYDKDQNTGIIFRAASTGPDLFYSTKNLVAHFKAILEATVDRPVIYFFNIFVLYKSPDKDKFTIIGIMDPKVGLNHKYHAWTEINWKRRRLRQAFFADKKFITIINNPKSKKSLHITSK